MSQAPTFETERSLIILTPTNPLVAIPAGLAGVIIGPFLYFAVGLELRRR